MLAMIVDAPGKPLRRAEIPRPRPCAGQLLIRVHACAVCRTDLHILDGELPPPKLPLIPGHEAVGTVIELGDGVSRRKIGDRVGIPWLGWTCGICSYCHSGQENLCDDAKFTGFTLDGGYAEYMITDERFCFAIPDFYSDVEAAPLLCAGLIGYRSLIKAGKAKRLGLYGFGAAAHIITQLAKHQQREVYAFSRPGDDAAQRFALRLGATWAGSSTELPPQTLDAALIFAPAGELVPQALRAVAKGGTVVCGGIHMSDIPSFAYSLLWEERTITSVANLTRRDGAEFMTLAAEVPVRTEVNRFRLEDANEALHQLRSGKLNGAAVLTTASAGTEAN